MSLCRVINSFTQQTKKKSTEGREEKRAGGNERVGMRETHQLSLPSVGKWSESFFIFQLSQPHMRILFLLQSNIVYSTVLSSA